MFSYQIFKITHIWGMAMTIGGTLTTFLLAALNRGDSQTAKATRIASHYVAGTGLVIVILSGLTYSALTGWTPFKQGGYMHAKMLFVALCGVFLGIDIRAQGVLRRARLSSAADAESLRRLCIKKQIVAGILSLISLMAILVLVEFKPF